MSEGLSGGCLCGAVRYSAGGGAQIVGDCYCDDCRKSSGTSHCTHVAVMDAAFDVTGAPARYDRPADSGNMISRYFCADCGSPLFSRNSGMQGMAFLRASCLDDPDAVSPAMTVYAARAPRWARINPDGPVFETMPEGGVPGVE